MTTMVRMFLLGTLVPLVSLDSAARDVFQSLVSIIDLFGIYYAVNQTVGKPEIKVSYSKIGADIFIFLDFIGLGWLGLGRERPINSFGLLEWRPSVRILLGIFQPFGRSKYKSRSTCINNYFGLALDKTRYSAFM